jgi:glutamine amidotransferase
MLTRSGIQCRRQVTPTTKNQRTRDDALSGHGTALVTHLRTARIGGASTANTQPFRHRDSLLAHAGTLTAFDRFRGDLLGALPPRRQNAIRGDTDSEHLFQLLLERHRQVPDRSPAGSLRVTLKNLTRWSTAAAPDADLSATLLWVVDGRLAAVRFNRPLYLLERTEPLLCPHCGHPHAYPASRDDYRAVVLASQPVTDEDWQEVPNQSAVSITAGAHATVTSLEDVQPVSWLSG